MLFVDIVGNKANRIISSINLKRSLKAKQFFEIEHGI